MSTDERLWLASAPRGLADLLARELSALGAPAPAVRGGTVQFRGGLEAAYRACLWSRVASRVLLPLLEFQAADEQEFYRQARAFDWAAEIDSAGSIACEFSGSHPAITNTHYGTLRLKDAICDRLREQTGRRPDVARVRPAVRLVAHARGTRLTLLLDLAGESLHRRGYRSEAGTAPLRENLAAGVLLRARWDELAARGAPFLDPMCGSGTLAIEAAMIAAQRAPGLTRDYFGFLGWRRHDAALWAALCGQARGRGTENTASLICGSDLDGEAVAQAARNAARAGVGALVRFERRALGEAVPVGTQPGLVCTNPPYGERLGGTAEVQALHAELGWVLRERFGGWEAAVLTAASEAARELRLRSYRVHELWNGPIACRLLRIDLASPGAPDLVAQREQRARQAQASPGAQMFANRLGKNFRRLERLARRSEVGCYRLYDADMPEYAFAIDRYVPADGGVAHLHVQEYAAPASVDAQAVRRRRLEALSVLPQVLQVPADHVHVRLRVRQRGAAQYRSRRDGLGASASTAAAAADEDGCLVVQEGGLRFRVNLDDYLDTGLFLDQRLTRAYLGRHARGGRFLNLFCYTATASVYAAAGGARESVSVDLSARYLDWAAQNFRLNSVDPRCHRLVRADCREWLGAVPASGAAPAAREAPFDLIFLDPPTFSNSKRMQGVLDVQRDHPALIDACLRLLAPGGLLLFSTNAQRFRLDAALAARAAVADLSVATLPFDFAQHPRIHRCFELRPQPR